MKIFVTGFHRGGTHTAAMQLAEKMGVPCFNEESIRWDSFEAAQMVSEGIIPLWSNTDGRWSLAGKVDPSLKNFVLQCPGLAHKTLELAKLGTVYWCTRPDIKLITAMKNAGIDQMAWHIMRQFRDEFPDDSIWKTLEYNHGNEDVKVGFVRYKKLLVEVKNYFYETYFKNVCGSLILEEQDWYDSGTDMSLLKPLKPHELEAIA